MLEQIEPKAAGEAQVRVVQHQILAIEHPALRHLPPVEPRRETIDGDRLFEVTGRIYGIVCQLQPGAAAGRGEPELTVEVAHAGHVVPGVDPDVGQLAADGEPCQPASACRIRSWILPVGRVRLRVSVSSG